MAKISPLPDVEFYDVKEDRDHFIWLAADKGLFKYNGTDYVKITHTEQKGNSFFQLQEDHQGVLWCNNIYGQIFFYKNDSLQLFYDANKLVNGQLVPFFVSKNKVTVYTKSGAYEISKTNKEVKQIFKGEFFFAHRDKQDSYVVMGESESAPKYSVCRISDDKIETLLKLDFNQIIDNHKVYAFGEKVLVSFSINNFNWFYLINKQTKGHQILETPKELRYQKLYKIIQLNDKYWFLTPSGIYVFGLEKNQFQFVEQIMPNESVTNVEIDFNNNYWFTTLDSGVFVIPNIHIKKVSLKNEKSKFTVACALDGNRFVLGTKDGQLLFYDNYQHIKTLRLPGPKIIGSLYYYAEQQKLIVSINASESYVVELENYNITHAKNKYAVGKAFADLGNGNLLYGNYKEAIVYNKTFTTDSTRLVSNKRVKSALNLNTNQFLIGHIDGLKLYDKQTLSAKEIKYKTKSILVNSMALTGKVAWLATLHNGLLKLEDNHLEVSKIPRFKASNQVNQLVAKEDFLWMATDHLLYRYNYTNNQLNEVGSQSGLKGIINNFIITQNYVVIVQPNGFYLLPNSSQTFKDYKTSKVAVHRIAIQDRDTVVSSAYTLPYDQNKIEIEFHSNGYQSNNYVNYHYRMQPLDSSWHDASNGSNTVTFNSLPNGQYSFEIKAKNINSEQTVSAAPITFVIKQPYWETWWFYGLLTGGMFWLIWLYFKWRLKKKESERIAEIDKILIDKKNTNLRLENLRSQMNPHFIFNALNSIQDYIVSNEKELASSYLVKFSRLIRMYLDYSQENEITLREELTALKLYLELEKVRFEDQLEYKIKIDDNLKTNQIKVPSLFIQPYVENALKHGLLHKANNRILKVEAKKQPNNKLQITIEDNGIGREHAEFKKRPNQQHKPFATRANQERVHLYKNKLKRDITIHVEDLKDKNSHPTGTKVTIILPIQ
ncbi:sensor histidine kinase [Tamlana crocina]|nr:histidine kinase [Tamlana crocina]